MAAKLASNKILQGDTLDILPRLPAKCIDLVFADPPYNLQLQQDLWRPNMTRVAPVNDAWDQFASFAAYDDFTREWLAAVRRVMKETATIWVSGTYHNIFRVGAIMQDLGFWILNTVTWQKTNAMPNFRGVRLRNDAEFVIWAKYSAKSRYSFNHHLMKRFNEGKQLGCVWTIPACGGPERLRDDDGKRLHPTQKPEELLTRIIAASSRPGDLVLDPFLGSGTTAAIAKRLHRNWIGIEREDVYFRAAQKRIKAVQPLPADDPLLTEVAIRHKRIPFRSLVERGYLQPGQTLYLDKPDSAAVILANGHLQANGYTGSIHKVGAQLKRVPSCNGWAHWYYIDPTTGVRTVIDTLRKQVREVAKKT
jgi:DNA modification methylase